MKQTEKIESLHSSRGLPFGEPSLLLKGEGIKGINKPPSPSRRRVGDEVRAFTLVELLVSISILATISIVAYTSYSGHMKTVNNATRIASIDSLHLSLSDYYQMKKILPEPNSNYIAYDERGTYMHSLSGSYGVSGYVSNDFLPAGYVNFRATDPESNQFYGYGKLLDGTSSFDVAAVLYDEKTGGYKTYIRGTYEKQRLSSLIRAYSSSNFVSQDSTEDLPYNPYERKITASVSSYSGTIILKNDKGELLSLTGELNSGDTITVATGSTSLLHISDGSELSLGSATSETVLKLTSLAYSDDNNLASKVVIFLTSGEVWTEAPHLRTEADSNSDFSIQTDSALAAVRGTVFGVTRDASGTTISLASGKLEVEKIGTDGTKTPFTQGFVSAQMGFVTENTQSYMIVPDGGQAIKLIVPPPEKADTPTSTGSLNPYDIDQKLQHPPFSLGYRPKADRISFSGTTSVAGENSLQTGILSVTFDNPGADSYELSFGTGEVDDSTIFQNPNPVRTGTLPNTGTVTLTGAFTSVSGPYLTRTYTLRVCFHGHCSAPDIKGIGGETFDFAGFGVWGEKKKKCEEVGTSLFPPFGCQDNHLVAYAPYDDDGDTNLYMRNDESTGGTSSGILGRLTPRTMTLLGNFGSTDSSTTHYPTNLFKSPINSFYQWGNTKGVLVPTGSPSSFLKYNLSPLNLGDNFSIEMSVRGGALKRTSGYYYLFGLSDGGGTFNANSLGFGLKNGVFGINAGSSYVFSTGITSTQINTFIINPDEFYKIIILINKSTNTAQLSINDNILPAVTIGGYTPANFGSVSSLNVGGPNHNVFQWNDIIDSIKIRKN
ncbi:MAG: FecR domain-containing protein [Candidatus Gracilibacteria bacterium]|nr:FecR domain-containing protein [Candidatus Gracilibacteria bacterium]